MRLIHKDGRKQTIPDGAYERHQSLYTRAGWTIDAVVAEPEAVAVQDEPKTATPPKATKAKQ